MNAKMKYFYEHYKSRSDSELSEIRCYMIFERADNDLKNEFLNLLARHEKLKFLEGWSFGLNVNEKDFTVISNELDELFTLSREVGGKLNAEEFISNNQGIEYISSFKNLLVAHPVNNKERTFATANYYTAKDVYNIVRDEDPLVISVMLEKMDKHSNTFTISKELRDMFGELPKTQSEVSDSTLREIERVLERKLASVEER